MKSFSNVDFVKFPCAARAHARQFDCPPLHNCVCMPEQQLRKHHHHHQPNNQQKITTHSIWHWAHRTTGSRAGHVSISILTQINVKTRSTQREWQRMETTKDRCYTTIATSHTHTRTQYHSATATANAPAASAPMQNRHRRGIELSPAWRGMRAMQPCRAVCVCARIHGHMSRIAKRDVGQEPPQKAVRCATPTVRGYFYFGI